MDNVILVSGQAEHGKTTFSKFLIQELERNEKKCLKISFADYLKFIGEKYFGWDGKKDEAGREFLQFLGTDIIRKEDEDFWVRIVFDLISVLKNQFDYFVIDDCRFISEVMYFEMSWMKYKHIRIVRPNFENALTEEQRAHSSETELKNVEPHVFVLNDNIVDLQGYAAEIAHYLTLTPEATCDTIAQ